MRPSNRTPNLRRSDANRLAKPPVDNLGLLGPKEPCAGPRLLSVGHVSMVVMSRSPDEAQNKAPRPLRPKDLFSESASGDAVIVSMRVTFVETKTTKSGQPWAVLNGQWRRHNLRCLVFPGLWATLEPPVQGEAVVVRGNLSYRDGEPVVWVLNLTTIALV
jgi:DNA polymerase III alpha subunit